MKVAYIMSRFPHLPETFILREMIALENEGITISLYPILFQREKVIHKDAQPWLKRVHRCSLFSPAVWIANLKLFFKDSGSFLRLFVNIIKAHKDNNKFLIRALIILPKAIRMAAQMKKEGIGHIHAHYATHPALAAYIINYLTGIPYSVSVHAHDIFVDQTMLCEKLYQASFIRAISEFNKTFLINHCGSKLQSRINVIHCGIDIEKYKNSSNKRKEKYQLLCIGSLQPYKGHQYLLDACALLKRKNINFSCQIIGGGELEASLQKMILDLGLEKLVHLIGRKTESEVADYLRTANCYIQPSIISDAGKMEGIPVSIMEAMASRLPVISTAISGIPELISDNVSGFLVPSGDAVALAERIFWVYEHPKMAEKLGETGYKTVKKNFQVKKVTLQLKDLFLQNYMAGEL